MRYYTQQLYDSMQRLSEADKEAASQRWEAACAAYHAHLDSIKPRLCESMRAFADETLHDGVITSAQQPMKDLVELHIDARRNPWGKRGIFKVAFRGVREVDGLADMLKAWWLYEEVHLHPNANFEYCVLLSNSEFRVVADDVVLERLSDR